MTDYSGCVVVYSHEHGVDVITTDTVAEAYNAVFNIMAEWATDLVSEGTLSTEKATDLVKMIDAKDMQSALELWNDETSEWFEIRKVVFPQHRKYGEVLKQHVDTLRSTIQENN